ncbi:hypothetical protein G7Y79_00029g063010 [Physcia stellaris]|nr:hypothetical protein G7Y79_00029g063010 [Physcia stellaris]
MTLKSYVHPPATKLQLDYAEIPILDFGLLDLPQGKEKLVVQLKEAVEQTGFFYVVNFGLSQADIDRQFAIGKEVLDLPEHEKLQYRANLEDGDYNGYRPLGMIEQYPGLRDNWECYHVTSSAAPPRHCPEVPEEFFVDNHQYEESCSSFLRYVKYHARTPEVNEKYKDIFVRGHTDFGSVTLFSRSLSEGYSCKPVMEAERRPSHTWEHRRKYSGYAALLDEYISAKLWENESEDLKAKRKVTVGDWVPIQTKKNWTPHDQQPQSGAEFQSLFR